LNRGVSHVTAFSASVALSAADGAAPLVPNADGSATQRVRLIPMGSFRTRGKGTLFIKDAAHAQQIVALSQQYAGPEDIAVDYDHQTVYGATPGVGGTAPASGWISPTSLSAEPDGIWGTIEWTAEAAAQIGARKYRYLSPYVAHDEKTGRVFALLNAGLTNTPAIVGLTKLAASTSHNPQDPLMDLTALAASLNLPATATLEEILAAQQAQATALSAAQASIAALNKALGLAETADPATALTTATALKASGGKDDLLTALQTQVSELTAERRNRFLDDATAQGRITPGSREKYVALMAANEAATMELINSMVPSLKPGAVVPGTPPAGDKATALSADQKDVAKLLGISDADYLKTLQENAQ